MTHTLLLGQTLSFSGDPFREGWETVTHHDSAGGVLIEAGRIVAVGSGHALRAAHPAEARRGQALARGSASAAPYRS